jgi:hypothetical protein
MIVAQQLECFIAVVAWINVYYNYTGGLEIYADIAFRTSRPPLPDLTEVCGGFALPLFEYRFLAFRRKWMDKQLI